MLMLQILINTHSYILRKSPELPRGAGEYELGGPWVALGSLASLAPAQPALLSPPSPHTQNLNLQPAKDASCVLDLNIES